jgi:hypothetical protein
MLTFYKQRMFTFNNSKSLTITKYFIFLKKTDNMYRNETIVNKYKIKVCLSILYIMTERN